MKTLLNVAVLFLASALGLTLGWLILDLSLIHISEPTRPY